MAQSEQSIEALKPQKKSSVTLKPEKKSNKRHNIIVGAFLVFLVIVGLIVWRAESFTNSITTKGSLVGSLGKSLPGVNSSLQGQKEGRINVLLLGVRGKGLPGGGELTDTIIVASLLREDVGDDWRYVLTSIPRDLLVANPNGGKSKINAVYASSASEAEGLETIKAVVGDVSGQTIHYAAMINFAGFENIIDVLGGVDLDLEEPFREPLQFNEMRVCDGDNGGVFTISTGEFEVKTKNGKVTAEYPLCTNESPECGGIFEVGSGKQTLTGSEALCYARSRATSSDFDRARRQQEVIAEIRSKATSVGLITDFDRINTILGTLGDNIQIDLEPWEVQKFFEFYASIGESAGTKVLDSSEEGLLEAPGEDQDYGYILLPRGGTYDAVHKLFREL